MDTQPLYIRDGYPFNAESEGRYFVYLTNRENKFSDLAERLE
jgi:hypothetical protein